MKYFLLIPSLLILPFALFASQDDLSKPKGTTQDAIVQLMPSHAIDKVGNKAEATRTVNVVVPQLVSLTLESNTTSLNLGEKAVLTVTGTYEDNSTKELTSDIEWVMTPSDSVEMNGMMLTALKDVNTTLQAKVGSILSNSLNLELYWEVNGHRLPPEPDPTVNNSTLLGIDSNDNGVRDDVERWIYEEYKDRHPIHLDIAMQAGRAKQKIILNPIEAKHEHNRTVAASYCEGYYATCINKDKEYAIHKRINGGTLKKIIFNTQERKQQNRKYHQLISGHSYSLPWCNELKAYCDFNTTKYEN